MASVKVLVVEPDVAPYFREIPGDHELMDLAPGLVGSSLAHMQDIVGGYIERVRTTYMEKQGIQMYVDEDGHARGKAPNDQQKRFSAYPGDIVGTVVFVGIETYYDEDGAGERWVSYPHDLEGRSTGS